MNIRQLKKQYKRKHGFNPPKGYSRAQIRKGIKLNQWQNAIELFEYAINKSLKDGIKAVSDAYKNMVSIGHISHEVQAILERAGIPVKR